jgi:hypothetical protein
MTSTYPHSSRRSTVHTSYSLLTYIDGLFTIPSFLSINAKQIISLMLTVDPVTRITIPGIRTLEWFNTGLPRYLRKAKNLQGDTVNIDMYPDILLELELVRYNFLLCDI